MLQPILVREIGDGEIRADRRRAAVAGGPARRAADHARPRPDRLRRPQPGAGAGGEPPPRGPQPAGGGRRLPAAGGRVRLHPRAGGRTGGQEPYGGHQHPPASPAARRGAAARWPTAPSRAGHARALLGTPDRSFQEDLAKRIVAEGLTVRAVEEAVRRHASGDDAPRRRRRADGNGSRAAAGDAGTAPRPRRCAAVCPPRACSSSRICSPPTSTPGSRWRWAPSEAGS